LPLQGNIFEIEPLKQEPSSGGGVRIDQIDWAEGFTLTPTERKKEKKGKVVRKIQ